VSQRAILHAVYAAKDRRTKKKQKIAAYIPRPPVGAEMSYTSSLRKAWDEVSSEVGRIVEAELRPLTDAERTDANPVASILERIEAALAATLSLKKIRDMAASIHERVNRFNLREVAASLVVSPQLLPGMREMSEEWSLTNARLITVMGDEVIQDLAARLRDEWARGARWEEIRALVQDRLGVGRSRAELIARDQVLKLNADLTAERHRAVGVTKYRWSSSRDERVRASHRALDGTTQSWANPPIVDPRTGRRDHPGQDYQCRCVAMPVFDD
jgi:SPP1 gp7 family putative phage head morphogenesis protein